LKIVKKRWDYGTCLGAKVYGPEYVKSDSVVPIGDRIQERWKRRGTNTVQGVGCDARNSLVCADEPLRECWDSLCGRRPERFEAQKGALSGPSVFTLAPIEEEWDCGCPYRSHGCFRLFHVIGRRVCESRERAVNGVMVVWQQLVPKHPSPLL